jgi:methyl-accepting chemotaxis protein
MGQREKRLALAPEPAPPIKAVIGKVPWRKRLTTRLFLWFFVLLAIGFTALGYQIYQMESQREKRQIAQSLETRVDTFRHTLSVLMDHQDLVGSRDLLDMPPDQWKRKGLLLLKADGQTLAFSDLSTIEDMRNRQILLPTLGMARRIDPSRIRFDLMKTPEAVKAYSKAFLQGTSLDKGAFFESRAGTPKAAFVLMKPIENAKSCVSCHQSTPILGYAAAYQSSAPYEASMDRLKRKLFWIFLGALETLVLLLVWITRGKFVTPLVTVSGEMSRFSAQSPDLKSRLPMKRDDEIGRFAFFVNRFIDLFQGWVGEISDRVHWVVSHSELLTQSMATRKREETERGLRIQNIRDRLHDLRKGMGISPGGPPTRETLSDLMDRSTILKTGIREVLDNLLETQALSERNKKGLELLKSGQNQIESVLAGLRDMEEQTNAVAMNAAVQASQAGPYGKVFRVVSDSMSQLALRMTNVTGQSSQKLSDLQKSLYDVGRFVEEGGGASGIEGRKLMLSQNDLDRLLGMMDQLGQTLETLERKMSAETEAFMQLEREIQELQAAHKAREAQRPVDDMRLREIMKVSKELEKELNRFKS